MGAGKSTVARLLAARGVPVIDADQIAREVVQPGRPALKEIAQRFPLAVASDGTLDRKLLSAHVFHDPAEREALNRIMHPPITAEVSARMGALAGAGHPVAVYKTPRV